MPYERSLLLLKDYSASDFAFDSYVAAVFHCLDQNEVEDLYLLSLKDTDLTPSQRVRLKRLFYRYISSVLRHDPYPFLDF